MKDKNIRDFKAESIVRAGAIATIFGADILSSEDISSVLSDYNRNKVFQKFKKIKMQTGRIRSLVANNVFIGAPVGIFELLRRQVGLC